MSTLKQIEANRHTSLKATGPRSVEGKTVTSMNALQTGIDAESDVIRGEDPQALVALIADYHREYQPSTPQMRALVNSLVSSEWLLRRLNKTEAQIWERMFQSEEENEYFDRENSLGEIFTNAAPIFSRLERRIDTAGRAWQRTYKELELLRPEVPCPPR